MSCYRAQNGKHSKSSEFVHLKFHSVFFEKVVLGFYNGVFVSSLGYHLGDDCPWVMWWASDGGKAERRLLTQLMITFV